jgi:hypothetical protein
VHINPLCGAQNSKAQYGLIYEDTRNTRGGLPQLTVVIKVNGDSKGTNERGPSLVASLGLSCLYKRFLFSLGAQYKIFFPTVHSFNFFVPIAQQAAWQGSRAGSPVF